MAVATRQAESLHPDLDYLDIFWPEDKSLNCPNILTFVTSPKFLNKKNVYPRQGTLLKILFLEKENLTEYDLRVIKEWEDRYLDTADEKGEGFEGIVPGVLDRIDTLRTCPCGHDRILHQQGPWDKKIERNLASPCAAKKCDCLTYRGRKWFREFISVIGRRGSKGHLGALAIAYILWHFIQMHNPQEAFGVDPDKRLSCIVFGGKKEQAKANQWRDINNVILGAPCFVPFISRPLGESLTVRSKEDIRAPHERHRNRVHTEQDSATFEIIPKESTQIAARGPASFALVFDEAAHVVKGVANVEADVVYESATPSLDQFGLDAFIYIPSSPWQRIGLFYTKYLQAIEFDPETDEPVYPEMLMVQLPSWDVYLDWETAHEIPMSPGGETYAQLRNAIQTYDKQMEQLERSNPETFRVERRARFANVLDAYLNEHRVEAIWKPWPTEDDFLSIQDRGKLQTKYRGHADPSKSGARFGFAIAHKVKPDPEGFSHVIFDVIHHWDPADFDQHEVNYGEIEVELKDYLDNFMPYELTFDQFNSVGTIQNLNKYVKKRKYPKHVSVYERPATGPLNWKTYETFKTALGLELVHAPYYEIANQELLFLQDLGGKVDAPTSGPVQTKDVADCMAIITYELIGDEISAFIGETLAELGMRGSQQGGIDPYADQRESEIQDKLSALSRGSARRYTGQNPSRRPQRYR